MLYAFLIAYNGLRLYLVAKFVTEIFPIPLNVMRNVNVILKQISQLNKTAVSGWRFLKTKRTYENT